MSYYLQEPKPRQRPSFSPSFINTTRRFINQEFRDSDYGDDGIETFKNYRPCSLDELAMRTSFNKNEIKIIYQGFKQECPSGTVNEETFKHIFGQFFPCGDTSGYARLIFSTFDMRSSGLVTFEDFLMALSTLCRGTIEERLRWIFMLYDRKRTGRLTRDDLHVIACAVYSLLGNGFGRQDNDSIHEHVSFVFQKFDKSRRGYITMDDFLSFCLQDPTITQSMEALRVTV